ncbi:MAG: RDD family protein, partial [Flavobacteriales bacterium]
IQYELASVGQRILAFLLDVVVLGLYYFVCTLIIAIISTNSYFFGEILIYILVLPVYFFYNLISEVYFDGQTVGKKILNIKVIKVDGSNPIINDYFIRWTYRVVDIFLSAGAFAAIFISASDKGQRLGDLSANTTLIKLNPDARYGIKDILNISKSGDYEPVYTQVIRLNDEDMLLIKNTIDRVSSHPNTANKKLANELIEKTAEILGIDVIPKQRMKFLKTLLKDYIVLTR